MRFLLAIAATFVAGLAAVPSPALAEDHAVGARVGLLGLGIEYTYRISDRLAVRGGLNGSGLDFDETESGIDYGFDLDFDSVAFGVDFHPFRGAFRVSGGVLQNDSSLSAVSRDSSTFTVGDTVYTAAEVGTLYGRIGFDDSTAPYLGLGFDWLRQKKVGLTLDFGLLEQGSPLVTLRADGPIADEEAFAADLAAEEAELNASLDDLDVWPFAMFGIVVRF